MTKFTQQEEWEYQVHFRDAEAIGHNAGVSHKPTPIRIYQADIMGKRLSEDSVIDDGCCGFAWINIKPANKRFAKWLKETERARPDSYYGGITIWIHDHNQSYEKKKKHAEAMASYLQGKFPDIKFRAMSRLDQIMSLSGDPWEAFSYQMIGYMSRSFITSKLLFIVQ